MKQRTALFFDDQRLTERWNLGRKIGHPILQEESVYLGPGNGFSKPMLGISFRLQRDRQMASFLPGMARTGDPFRRPFHCLPKARMACAGNR